MHHIVSVVHILFECLFTIIVRQHTSIPINLSSIPPKTASKWVKSILNPINLLGLCPFFGPSFPLLAAIACDRLWWSRNKLIFEDIPLLLISLLMKLTEPTNLIPMPGYLRSIWIELILLKLKTENWKHCNKIIFKCVNSAVRTVHGRIVKSCGYCSWTMHE